MYPVVKDNVAARVNQSPCVLPPLNFKIVKPIEDEDSDFRSAWKQKIHFVGTLQELEGLDSLGTEADRREVYNQLLSKSENEVFKPFPGNHCVSVDTCFVTNSGYLPVIWRNLEEHAVSLPKLFIEAQDSLGNWVPIEEKYAPTQIVHAEKNEEKFSVCGGGMLYTIPTGIEQGEVAVAFIRAYNEGSFKTKLRVRSGDVVTEEFFGSIDYRKLRSRHFPDLDSHERYEFEPVDYYKEQLAEYYELLETSNCLKQDLLVYRTEHFNRLGQLERANLDRIAKYAKEPSAFLERESHNLIRKWRKDSTEVKTPTFLKSQFSNGKQIPFVSKQRIRKKNISLNANIRHLRANIEKTLASDEYAIAIDESRWEEAIQKDRKWLLDNPTKSPYHNVKVDSVYNFPHEAPMFQNNESDLMSYLEKNLKYPKSNFRREGRIFVRLVVTKGGGIKNVEILNDVDGFFGEEVKNTLAKMPEQWTPGKIFGNPVDSRHVFQIRFQLD